MKILSILFLIILFSSCSSSIKTLELETGEELSNKQIIITLETYFNNYIKIFKDDTLVFEKRVKTRNPKILTVTEVINLGYTDNHTLIEIKVGKKTRKKIQMDYHEYAYIKRNKFTGRLKCELTNSKRFYR